MTPSVFGIIAGNGDLPLNIANQIKQNGDIPFIMGIAGEADERIKAYDHDFMKWGEIGKLFKSMRGRRVKKLIIAGGVSRPDLSKVRFDLVAIRNFPFFLSILVGGDNKILNDICGFFQKNGFEIVGAHEIVPQLLAGKGALGKYSPNEKDLADINKGAEIISTLGPFDIGQGAVVSSNYVLAIEAAEGTDRMLERCQNLRQWGKIWNRKKRGVFVKMPKPGQNLLIDMPVIGQKTIKMAEKAQLKGIAIAAGHVMIPDFKETINKANQSGIFLYGFDWTNYQKQS